MPQLPEVILKNKGAILYGCSLAILLLLLKWLEFRWVVVQHATEIYTGAVALLFTCLGIWLAVKLAKPKTVIVEKEVVKEVWVQHKDINEKAIETLGLSKREMEVLQLMSEGLSNQEIADRLFVSLNTVKTHCSRLFEKMDVKRRTQAVELAKRLFIIA